MSLEVRSLCPVSPECWSQATFVEETGSHNSGPSSDEMTVPYSPFFFKICLGLQHECEHVWGRTWLGTKKIACIFQHFEPFGKGFLSLQLYRWDHAGQLWGHRACLGPSLRGVCGSRQRSGVQVFVRNGIFMSCKAGEFHVQPMISCAYSRILGPVRWQGRKNHQHSQESFPVVSLHFHYVSLCFNGESHLQVSPLRVGSWMKHPSGRCRVSLGIAWWSGRQHGILKILHRFWNRQGTGVGHDWQWKRSWTPGELDCDRQGLEGLVGRHENGDDFDITSR